MNGRGHPGVSMGGRGRVERRRSPGGAVSGRMRCTNVERLLVGAALAAAIVAAAVGPCSGQAAPPRQASGRGVTVARLKYRGGGDWYANPTSIPNLLEALRSRTDIEVDDGTPAVAPGDDELLLWPIVHATGHGRIVFDDDEAASLRTYLERGGFLWVDDNYGMDRSFREAMGRVFPEAPLVEPLSRGSPFPGPLVRAGEKAGRLPDRLHGKLEHLRPRHAHELRLGLSHGPRKATR